MFTFAQKPGASLQTPADSTFSLGRPNLRQSSSLNSPDQLRVKAREYGNSTAGSFDHDFSRIPVHSKLSQGLPASQDSEAGSRPFLQFDVRSDPPKATTKQPAAPDPKKDEKPFGTMKDKDTGAEEKMYASFVTSGLWWFNGGSPSLGTLYNETAEIPVDSLGKGDFNAKVTAGADKVAFDSGGSTLTGKDLKKITVKPLAPSTKSKDVTIEIHYHAPGSKTETVIEVKLEVRAPDHLDLLGTDHLANGKYGYTSLTSLRVFDNFGQPMPYIEVNEDFSKATMEKGVASEFKDGMDARTKGNAITHSNAVFQDKYSIAPSDDPKGITPTPSNPTTPLGKAKVGSFTHDWYVGSDKTGKGVHVSHHIGVFYADHAEYTSFVSPPAAAKKP